MRQSRKPSKHELNVEQIKCMGLSRNSDHAPLAGKELTAGGTLALGHVAALRTLPRIVSPQSAEATVVDEAVELRVAEHAGGAEERAQRGAVL